MQKELCLDFPLTRPENTKKFNISSIIVRVGEVDLFKTAAVTMGKHKDHPETFNHALLHLLDQFPGFADIFDEETFYWTFLVFVLSTFLLAYYLSRNITIKAVD